jgi:hypothetical protein
LGHIPVALFVDVEPMCVAGRLAVEDHAEGHRRAGRGRADHEVDVAGVEAVRDSAPGSVEHVARPSIVQSPSSAHWLSISMSGTS